MLKTTQGKKESVYIIKDKKEELKNTMLKVVTNIFIHVENYSR